MRHPLSTAFAITCLLIVSASPTAHAQNTAQNTAQNSNAQYNIAQTRMRPIGSPSAVDRYPQATVTSRTQSAARPVAAQVAVGQPSTRNETAFWQPNDQAQGAEVVQTVWMQSAGGGLALPPGAGQGVPGATAPVAPSLPTTTPFPEAAAGPAAPSLVPSRSLPQPSAIAGGTVPSPSDYAPMAQPQLPATGFANMDNCRMVTPPSTYSAAFASGCGQTYVVPTNYAATTAAPITTTQPLSPYAGVPAEVAPTVTLPATTTIVTTPPSAAPVRSLFTLGQEKNPVQVGQGLWGQPKAYVPGQGFRNWIRYFFP